MSLEKLCFSFSTAPALQHDECTMANMPAIKMELLRSYRYDEVLAGDCTTESCAEFPRLLPQILAGECPEWYLWDVNIEVGSLTLHFASREQVPGNKDLLFQAQSRKHGVVRVVGPTAIGLRFTVPALLDQPETIYECMMSSSGTGHSHSLQLTESFTDPKTGAPAQNIVNLSQNIG